MIRSYMRNNAVAIIALIVAVVSLGYTAYQVHILIKHNHVSVEPRITAYQMLSPSDDKVGVYVVNNGLGPAFFEHLSVYIDGVDIKGKEILSTKSKFYPAIELMGLKPDCFIFTEPDRNHSIAINEEVALIKIKASNGMCDKELKLFMEQHHRLDFQMDFKSIYHDKFSYTYQNNTQVER
ncbi:hypothetical protein [Yersinia mollaretii]|uniref:hypothetical protein n=1 Tax=Yersinia mollaretii TaxID=33060 RepID=UPI0011A10487|nr:hypothetical protein [Yersinia mollaretii]